MWCAIAKTFERLCPLYPDEDQKKLLGQVVLCSTGGAPTAYPEIAKLYASVCEEMTGEEERE